MDDGCLEAERQSANDNACSRVMDGNGTTTGVGVPRRGSVPGREGDEGVSGEAASALASVTLPPLSSLGNFTMVYGGNVRTMMSAKMCRCSLVCLHKYMCVYLYLYESV